MTKVDKSVLCWICKIKFSGLVVPLWPVLNCMCYLPGRSIICSLKHKRVNSYFPADRWAVFVRSVESFRLLCKVITICLKKVSKHINLFFIWNEICNIWFYWNYYIVEFCVLNCWMAFDRIAIWHRMHIYHK